MKDFGITADMNRESGVRETLGLIPTREFFDYFYLKNYGSDLNSVFIILMCRNNELNFKRNPLTLFGEFVNGITPFMGSFYYIGGTPFPIFYTGTTIIRN